MIKMNNRTSSDNEDSPLSYKEDLITWEEERLDSDIKCLSVEDKKKKDRQKLRKKVYNTRTQVIYFHTTFQILDHYLSYLI